MLVEGLVALASLAGNTVVAAATTDAWEAARRGFARLLGRGNPKQEQLAEQRLEETRQQLAAAEDADLEQARSALAERWAGRGGWRRARRRRGGGPPRGPRRRGRRPRRQPSGGGPELCRDFGVYFA